MEPTRDSAGAELKRFSRRDLIRAGALVGGGLVLSACAPTPSAPAPSTGPTAAPKPTGLSGASGAQPAGAPATPRPDKLVFAWQTVSNQNTLFKPALDQWEKDFGISYQWITTGTTDEEDQKVLSLSAAGEAIDFFAYSFGAMGQFAKQKLLAPLDGLPHVEEYFAASPPALRPLMQVDGKTVGMPQFFEAMACAVNEPLLAKAGLQAPPTTWDEFVDACLKAKRDGISEYPAVWAAGVGIFIVNYVWYSLVASRGGTITDKDGAPTLGPGSVARDTLAWWARTFNDWQISDPASLQMRYYPAAKAYASGKYLFEMSFLPDTFALINGGDSPTKGQHRLFLQPGGKGLLHADAAGISSTSKSPDWAWALLQYLVGQSKDGQWLGATNMASLLLVPYPKKAVEDATIKAQWTELFGDLDGFFKALDTSVSLPQIMSITRESWYPKWTDFVVARLQDCLAGKMTADAACDAMADNMRQLRGQ